MSKITRDHDFLPVKDHAQNTIYQQVWRCDKCDSEVIFSKGKNGKYVNDIMAMRLRCIPRENFVN